MNINAEIKRRLRTSVARVSSYIEIMISVLILIGILVATISWGTELIAMSKEILKIRKVIVPIEEYLATGLQLIVGVEFVKMISKHTVDSVIDVLLFAIARKMIVSHGSSIDVLIGILSIAILFVIKYYFDNKGEKSSIEQEKLSLWDETKE